MIKIGFLLLLLTALCLVLLPFSGNNDFSSLEGSNPEGFVQPYSNIIINQSQTWYGDFIVNQTDIVIIENCNFTVGDGNIKVYGELFVRNSSIELRNVESWSQFHYFTIYGKLYLNESRILRALMYSCDGSQTSIVESSFGYLGAGNATIYISNSTFVSIDCSHPGQSSIVNSTGEKVNVFLFSNNTEVLIGGSNVTSIMLSETWTRPSDIHDELRPGYVENICFINYERGLNVTIRNCNIEKWEIDNPGLGLRLVNSTVHCIHFPVCGGPAELNMTSGFIANRTIYVPQSTNATIINSTIEGWRVTVQGGTFQIVGSNFDLSCKAGEVSVLNSTMGYFLAGAWWGHGRVTITDSVVRHVIINVRLGSLDVVLHEGYNEYSSFYNEKEDSNVTIARTTVNHWSVQAWPGSKASVNIHNSTITVDPLLVVGLWANTNTYWYIDNSTVELVSCYGNSSLTIVNSTIDRIHAYQNSNITAINSTIGAIISDPPYIELIESKTTCRLYFSFEIPSELLSLTISDGCAVPLPQEVTRTSKYLHVTTSCDKIFEVQIRIYYYEKDIVGFDEQDLRMYSLEETSNRWQPCSVQGVNLKENYVWANVTHFSYFVIGYTSLEGFQYGGTSRFVVK